MSKEVDQRVVEMQFDNKQFEQGVSTTMSSVEKLKKSLKFDGVSKGFDDVSKSAKNVNLSGLGGAIDTIQAKFSAMQVVGMTALANLTNSAVNAGKRMISALTIDPVKSGFQEYETQINAVQTILANTQSKGTTLDQVNQALDTLNTYADKTIYNFTEMTRNIGTFTAAGVDLDTSVKSIQGIANLAAVSGSNAQQASTAMYQLSQALAAGTVKLTDWNSVVTAGMGGQVFQDALKETARVHGIAIDDMIKEQGSFRETLQKGWLSSEILTETLEKFTLTTEGLTDAQIQQNREMLKSKGYTDTQIDEIFKLGATATDAATKVKTFTQLMNTLKEAAQSGWTQTWEILIGDFEESKELLTSISDYIGNIINKASEKRNNLLEGAMTSNWDKMIKKINEAGFETSELEDKIRQVAKAHNVDIDKIVDKYGSLSKAFKSGAISSDILQEAINGLGGALFDLSSIKDKLKFGDVGDDVTKVQKALRYLKYDLGSFGEDGVDGIIGEYTEKAIKAFQKDNNLEITGIVDEKTLEALDKATSKTNSLSGSVKGLVDDITKLGGRELLIESLKNIFGSLAKIIQTIGIAWRNTFPAMNSNQLYGIIEKFHKFTESLKINGKTVINLFYLFNGLFDVLKVIKTFAGGALSLAFKLLTKVLGKFNLNISDLAASIGKLLTKFSNWVLKNNFIEKSLDKIAGVIATVVEKVGRFVRAFVQLPAVQNTIEQFKKAFTFDNILDKLNTIVNTVKKLFNALLQLPFVQKIIENFKGSFDSFSDIGKNLVDGLVEGINDESNTLWNVLVNFAKNILNTIREALGIHSPSTETHEDGLNLVQGFINGIKDGATALWSFLKGFASKLVEFLGNIDWGAVIAGGVSIALFAVAKKIGDAISAIAAPMEGLGNLFNSAAGFVTGVTQSVSKVLKGFAKTLKAFAFSIKAKALKDIAMSLLILVGAIAILTYLDPDRLWESVGIVATLAGILLVLSLVIDKMNKSAVSIDKGGLKVNNFKTSLLSIAASLLILGATVKMIGSMSPDQMERGFTGLAGVVVSIGMVLLAYATIMKGDSADSVDKASGVLLKMVGAMAVLVILAKMIAKMTWDDMGKAAAGMGGLIGIMALLVLITKMTGENADKLSGTIVKIAVAMGALVLVAKLISKMTWGDMGKAAVGMLGLVGIISLLVLSTKMAGPNAEKLGSTLLGIASSIAVLVIIAKMISGMTWGDMGKAAVGLVGLAGVIALLVLIVKMAGKDAPKIATTLLALSVAIGILAGVAVVLSLIDTTGLVKGIAAVVALGTIMSLMIYATRGAGDCKGNIIAMAAAIAVMATSVAILSFIDPSKLAGATAAMTILMGMFALMTAAAGKAVGAMGSLIVMTVAIGLIATAIYVLTTLPVESVLTVTASLCAVLLSLSASFAIISRIPVTAAITGALGLVAFVGIVGLLLAALGGLSKIDGVSELIASGGELLSAIGYAIGNFVGSIIGGFGAGLTSGLPEIGENLSAFMENISGFIEGIKMVDSNAIKGAGCLAGAIIALTGAEIINAIGSFLSGGVSFAQLGSELSAFAVSALPFIAIASTIDPAAMEGAKTLAETLVILTAGSLLDGISNFLGLSGSIEDFAGKLVPFGEAIAGFSAAVSGKIDTDAVNAAANAGKIMAEMNSAIPSSGGLIQKLTGEKDLGKFSENLTAFGEAIVGFSKKVSEEGAINEDAVTAAANAGKIMIAMNDALPKTGGLVQLITGEQDMTKFGENLTSFGEAIVGFSKKVSEEGAINEGAITAAANAGTLMSELQGSIESTGGVVDFFTGTRDLGDFGEQIKAFGQAMVDFSSVVSEGGINETSVTAAANAGKIMAELQKSLPEDGWFDSVVSLDDFGDDIVDFGESIAEYSDAVKDVDNGVMSRSISAARSLISIAKSVTDIDTDSINNFNVDAIGEAIANYYYSIEGIDTKVVSSSITSAKNIVSLVKSLVGIDTSGISNFKVAAIGVSMKAYHDKVSGIKPGLVSSSISSAKQLVSLINSMTTLDTSGVSSFISAVNSLGELQLDKVVKAFDGGVSKITNVGMNISEALIKGMNSKQSAVSMTARNIVDTVANSISSKNSVFSTTGLELVSELASGIKKGSSKVESSTISTLSDAVDGTRLYYNRFYYAGSYLVTGFAKGISENAYKAAAKASVMAKAAVEAAESALGINSPSKVFYKIGEFTIKGFINALEYGRRQVYVAGSVLGDTAKDGLNSTINRIADFINGDIDVQPTIRPVLDLSNVEHGVDSISRIFSNGPSLGVMANLNAINTTMNRRNQNGSNDDVISAIDRLRDALGESRGDTYNIDGVTYDDGSNVADAVQTLVRYARIGRRV